MTKLLIACQLLNRQAVLPKSWSEEAIGFDLHALCISDTGRPNTVMLPQRQTRMVSTGIMVKPPLGYFCSIWSRSGLALKSIWVANAPGLIDPDYRGEIKVLLYNGGHEPYYVKHHDRVAQLVLLARSATTIECRDTEIIDTTLRGIAGFGSTGS